MPLNKPMLIADLTAIFTPDDKENAKNLKPKQVAEKMANAIEKYIKSGTVNTTVSTTVVGALTPPAAVAGTGTGAGTGSIT